MSLPQSVIDAEKVYERVTVTARPLYEQYLKSIDYVREFIISKGLIVYGGTAIDYALRLHGDNIYPDDDLALPDLDFYSPKNVEHGYELADILYAGGADGARVFNAVHLGTVRVDAGDNFFIADISYSPQEIFDRLPYLEYNGMKIIHPDFQRIDIHSSLAHPYDNAPREVIFARWNKDIKRFNLLDKYFPIKTSTSPVNVPLETHTVDISLPLTGWAGYAAIASHFAVTESGYDGDEFVAATFRYNQNIITFNTLNGLEQVGDCGHNSQYMYEQYINLIPESCRTPQTTIYSTAHSAPGINEIKFDGVTIKVTNVQYLLKYFMSMHFVTKKSEYLAIYKSLLYMISYSADDIYKPSLQVYGYTGINSAQERQIQKSLLQTGQIKTIEPVPESYRAGTSRTHPEFNPDASKYYRIRGKKVV
jgi:hypothetical protein